MGVLPMKIEDSVKWLIGGISVVLILLGIFGMLPEEISGKIYSFHTLYSIGTGSCGPNVWIYRGFGTPVTYYNSGESEPSSMYPWKGKGYCYVSARVQGTETMNLGYPISGCFCENSAYGSCQNLDIGVTNSGCTIVGRQQSSSQYSSGWGGYWCAISNTDPNYCANVFLQKAKQDCETKGWMWYEQKPTGDKCVECVKTSDCKGLCKVCVDYVCKEELGCIPCGDGICQEGQNYLSCPQDCPTACGNEKCEVPVESYSNCPKDCPAKCNNNVCETPDESYFTCPQDCPAKCGNAVCEKPIETCKDCPSDCGKCPLIPPEINVWIRGLAPALFIVGLIMLLVVTR